MRDNLKKEIIQAIKKDIENEKSVGLFFSSGLDSSLIGKILVDLGVDVFPITIGLKNSKDIIFSKKIAKKIFKKHIILYIKEDIIEKIIPEVIKITKNYDAVNVSVGCVTYLASKYASKMGTKIVFTGLGCDEIFCGYNSHMNALNIGYKKVQEECKNRLDCVKKDLKRDTNISKHFKLKIKTPFLNENIIKIGMKIAPTKKINKNTKKIIIRNIGKEIGLPFEVYKRKKIAAQYGSGIQKIIKKISKKKGFDTVEDFLKNVYKKQINM